VKTRSKNKNQCLVMLIMLFIMLNVDYLRLYGEDNTTNKVLVTYANQFQKANLTIDTGNVANDVITGKVVKEEEEKKKAEEEKQKALEEAWINNVVYYPSDNIGTTTNIELANEIVNYAKQFVGNPYVYGGNSLTNGTDCSGFTMLVFANFGISLPRTSMSQGYVGTYVNPSNRQIGDLVLYGYGGNISHVALYIGDNQVVHALNSNDGILITNYDIMPIITVRRVL